MKRSHHARSCFLLLTVLLSQAASAGPLSPSCRVGPKPSASLLLPYFEVDLVDAQGPSTLLTVGSTTGGNPQLTRWVIWTDWGIPVASYDLLIPGDGQVSVNVRDLLTEVGPPITAEGLPRPAGCTDPVSQPGIDLENLVRRLTGQESPVGSDVCWSSDRGDPTIAVGFLTIDTISDCVDSPRYPTDEGYFGANSDPVTSLATQDNVLYGDFFLVEPREDFAQGAALVHLPADADVVNSNFVPSFYGFVPGVGKKDARRPVSSRYVSRFFNGGAFSGGTEVLLWNQPHTPLTAVSCEFAPPPQGGEIGSVSAGWGFRTFSEGGEGPSGFSGFFESPGYVWRQKLDESFVGELAAGTIDFWSLINCRVCSPPFSPNAGVVIPLHSAEGRFSVGLEAIALDDRCNFDPQ